MMEAFDLKDVQRGREESRHMAERLSKVLASQIPDVDFDIRYTYHDRSFRLWWGERGDPQTTALITFQQLSTLNDEELKQIIRSSVVGGR